MVLPQKLNCSLMLMKNWEQNINRFITMSKRNGIRNGFPHKTRNSQLETRNPQPVTLWTSPKLLIVEDDSSVATPMKWVLAQDYEILLAEDRVTAMDLFNEKPPPWWPLISACRPIPLKWERVLPHSLRCFRTMLRQDYCHYRPGGEGSCFKQAIGQGAYDSSASRFK